MSLQYMYAHSMHTAAKFSRAQLVL